MNRRHRGLLTSAVAIHAGACLVAFLAMGSLGSKATGGETLVEPSEMTPESQSEVSMSLESYLEEQRLRSNRQPLRASSQPQRTSSGRASIRQ